MAQSSQSIEARAIVADVRANGGWAVRLPSLPPQDWSQLVADLVATFFGALLGAGFGFGAALWIQDKVAGKAKAAEEKQERERRRSVLDSVRTELRGNHQILNEISDQLVAGESTDQGVLSDIWLGLKVEALEAIQDAGGRNNVNRAYHELRRVAVHLERLEIAFVDPAARERVETTTVPVLKALIEGVHRKLTEAVESLDQEIESLAEQPSGVGGTTARSRPS